MKQLTMTRELAKQIDKIKTWLVSKESTHVEEVWCSALGKDPAYYDRRASIRMSIILTTYCGWVKSGLRERVDGSQKWMYRPINSNDDFSDVLG